MPNSPGQSDDLPAQTPFRYELRDDLPDNEIVIPIEADHGTIIAIRPGHMTPELAAKLNRIVACLIATGIWRRHL